MYQNTHRVAKFACPRVLDAQKLSEDNQNLRSGCPPDYQIFLGKYFENSCPYKFFEVFILTLSFSNKHISFWELKTNRILYGIKMRATKNMSRTTRFSILVVLRLPTFDSNFATLTHNNEFGGAISANYRGFFTISCLLFDIFRGGMAPWFSVQWAISNVMGLIPHPAGLGISLPLRLTQATHVYIYLE